jgi:hypothetical protein
VSRTVVETVAAAEDVHPIELDPLGSVVDTDVLESIVQPQTTASEVPDSASELRFTYQGYRIRVTATGRVALEDDHE